MNFFVKMLPTALDDLEAIWQFIGTTNGNPDAADDVLRSICSSIAFLPRFPERGPLCSEFKAECQHVRRLNVSAHTVYYRIEENVIEVGRIIHDRREREEILRRWLSSGIDPS